ncbi:MAG: hypothetical protein ACHP9V_06125 [Terriglobales bacterium]
MKSGDGCGRGITPEINAISTIIFVFSLIAIVFWYRLRTRAEVTPEIGAELVGTTKRWSAAIGCHLGGIEGASVRMQE